MKRAKREAGYRASDMEELIAKITVDAHGDDHKSEETEKEARMAARQQRVRETAR